MRMNVVFAAAAALAFAAPAAAETTVKAEVLHKVVTMSDAGVEQIVYEPVTKAIPGEQLTYRLTIENSDEKPATAVGMAMAINPNLVVDPKSVTSTSPGADPDVTFSADGGETFAAYDELTVELADGVRPAHPDDLDAMRINVAEIPGETAIVIEYGAYIR